MKTKEFNNFFQSYIGCALWSSSDNQDEPLDKNYNINHIAPECLKQMEEDCYDF